MGAAVATTFLGDRRGIWHLTSFSTATAGETTATKVSATTLTGPNGNTTPTLRIDRVCGHVSSGAAPVTLYWNTTTPEVIAVLSGDFDIDFTKLGGKHPTATGGNSNILLSTPTSVAVGEGYDIVVETTLKG